MADKVMVVCTVDDCLKLQMALGFCSMHYARTRKHGSTNLPERPVRLCSVPGCEQSHWSKDFCAKHYQQWRTRGVVRILPEPRARGGQCQQCDRPAKALGFCNGHYQRFIRGSPLDAPWRHERPKRHCTVDGCGRTHFARGLCHFHDARRRGGTALDYTTPERTLNPLGYVLLLVERGKPRVFEHRAVMERMIGRPLRREENVHHINGQRDDNRPENLELWSTSQPAGQRVVDKVAWAKELLALYEPDTSTEGAS